MRYPCIEFASTLCLNIFNFIHIMITRNLLDKLIDIRYLVVATFQPARYAAISNLQDEWCIMIVYV